MQLEDDGEKKFSGSETYEEKDAMLKYFSVVHTAQLVCLDGTPRLRKSICRAKSRFS